MMSQIKNLIKRIFKLLHINVRAAVKGIDRKSAVTFFKELDDFDIEYVILRWYDQLPVAEPGEDFDILVSNKDCRQIGRMLKRGNVSNKDFIKCDIFPVNNTKGLLAYYPPFLAEKCLENRVKDASNVWVLDTPTYFFALAYHALFHKGYKSGLPSKYRDAVEGGLEHDYKSILHQLAKKADIIVEDESLEGYEKVLKENDWVPPLDVYFRRSQKNGWILDRLKDTLPDQWYQRKGLACFVLRELGAAQKWVDYVSKLIHDQDAEIISVIELRDSEKAVFAKYTRGSDWDKGPFQVSGGLPAKVIVARRFEKGNDVIPHGVVEYGWVKNVKETVRRKYNQSVPYRRNSNILHSTDNGVEASYYISILKVATGNDYESLL